PDGSTVPWPNEPGADRRCGRETASHGRWSAEGRRRIMNCPACGVAVPDGARFCAECGQRLATAPDERRLVTVLMADLVGFTALSAASDPEQVKRLVDDTFERLLADITAFGGRLAKIVGGEPVAHFGAPGGHAGDAQRV